MANSVISPDKDVILADVFVAAPAERVFQAISDPQQLPQWWGGNENRTVEKVIDEGATTVAAVGRRCGAGTDCGSCQRHLARMIAERLREEEARQEPVWTLPLLQTG